MRRPLDLSPRKLPTQARARATYTAIVQAAARVLERDGYEALTTNGVAEVAGVGVASLYEYFPNKHAVVAAVVTATVEEVFAEIEAALELALQNGEDTGLSLWIGAMFDAIHKRRALATALVREVPFLYDVPAMRAVRRKLLGLTSRGQGLRPRAASVKHLDAVLYLLPLMVSSAVVESAIRPPRGIARKDIEAALIDVLKPFLFPTRG
jgi:AcrR family transcriptional regulator